MERLLLVLFAHYVGDYPLQGAFLAQMKGNYDYLLFCHALIWAGCVCVVLGQYGCYEHWKLVFLLVPHFLIDRWKARHKNAEQHGLTRLLWIDQFLHALQCIIVSI